MGNLNIYRIQMAYFFRQGSQYSDFKLISGLYNQLSVDFGTEPRPMPIPDDAPDDIPRFIWSDVNINLTFNKSRLDFSFNIPTKAQWEELIARYNVKIMQAIDEQNIIVDRVGLVSELMSQDDLQGILGKFIQIEKFNNANEANLSWLENFEGHNVWTYFIINKLQDINKIVFDINTLPGDKLKDRGISGCEAMKKCAEILETRVENVLYL